MQYTAALKVVARKWKTGHNEGSIYRLGSPPSLPSSLCPSENLYLAVRAKIYGIYLDEYSKLYTSNCIITNNYLHV